ncbi:aminoglycoside phosphotransferase (APT) family kinase protein [Novosphingobium hassiacum]|uniref:Aminoglycoside phosphotransferase (APT) family kinase protein n=1 Tax=Novosphingobium hassiacum TaxID=173676 RepID=A0A7W5ZYK7_9SPHN|nr:phosphotransferase family protein [Novosphingobium hassiacum]MBB3861478.1 aminoglycoside phosphotransferase (APT) family kinase protein [Novosphingobium hassiacum]
MTDQLDAQAAFTGTVAPEGADRLDEAALTRWCEANVAGFEGPLTVAKFKGGQSNPTYRIDSPSGPYVLRRKPLGKLLPSAHAVDREFRVQSGLHSTGFPVPRQYGLCTDDSVLGSWFYVMGCVDGRSIWDGAMPGATPEFRRATYFAMVDTLAQLHQVDLEAAGLSTYGKPGNYFGRQVERWTSQYRLAETETMPDMERLIAWLPSTLPTQDRTSVVHGDYRIDNLIFARNEARVAAVLDWELSTLGDPLADFTYFCMAWVTDNAGRSGVQDVDRKALGIPELDEVVARYCAKTGREGISDINWYLAFNFFRLAGIIQGIKKRVIEGTASSAHAKAMSERVAPLAEAAWSFAVKAGAR